MFSHFTLGSNDLGRAKNFYTAVMAVIGQELISASPDHGYLKFGLPDHRYPHLFISRPFDTLPATWSNGYHLAFNAQSTDIVDRFYETAMAQGGFDDGIPGIRPHYAKDYYGTYVRDPDGNKLQAVCYTEGRSCGATGETISHITIGLANLARERVFYTAVLAILGIEELAEEGDAESVGYGFDGCDLPIVYVQPPYDKRPATWGNGTHTAFSAKTREQVDQFYSMAIANGGTCDGPPGPRSQYSPHYYAAYVRDPVGNKLQAVCREPA